MDSTSERAFLPVLIAAVLIKTASAVVSDYPWTVSLTVANEAGSNFEGRLELVAEFENETRQSILLPYNRYEIGRDYSFSISLVSSGQIRAVRLRTMSFCPLGLLPTDVLRLQRFKLVSDKDNTTYDKHLRDLVIKDACQLAGDSLGTEIRDFDTSLVEIADLDVGGECLLDGVVYADGQTFEMNCKAKCACDRGTISCVDNCPATTWAPEDKCRAVRVPGRCCDEVRCDEDPRMQTCQTPKSFDAIVGDGSAKRVRPYPWAVLICLDDNCKNTFGGVVASEKHVLVFAPDVTGVKEMRLSSGKDVVETLKENNSDMKKVLVENVIVHPDFSNVRQNESVSAVDNFFRLQLIELKEPFVFNEELQAVNLPLSDVQCVKLSSSECAVSTIGWDSFDDEIVDESGVVKRSMMLHAQLSNLDPRLCDLDRFYTKNGKIVAAASKRRGGKRTCVAGLLGRDCSGIGGGVVAATAADNVDFIVGMLDRNSDSGGCTKLGARKVLPLCKYVDWIVASLS